MGGDRAAGGDQKVAKAIVHVHHHVAEYEHWRPFFDEHQKVREKHGATGHRLYRSAEDPNDLVVVNEFATLEGARAFAADPSLRDVMAKARVDRAPEVLFLEEAEVASYR
jgi:hypothetical protein